MKKIFLAFILLSVIPFMSLAQLNMSQLGFLPYSQSLSDVWGYVDETGNEYALVGVFNGLSVVDISDPANPVEIFFGNGDQSIWRDIKTWGDYAYVSNESGNGIYIVDLSPLPGGAITSTTNFTGGIFPFQTAHNLYIDEEGKLFVFGSNNGNGGAIIFDLTQDPMNPVELGRFNDYYLHDGMARGDTLWGAAIYVGVLAAIDVSDPSNPQVMGIVSTPSQFTHNAWVSGDGTHVFTTDEVSSGFIGAFNVTDVTNMFETDRIRSSTGTDVIPHNTHVYNDFLVTSYYADGIVVHDAKYPDKLIEVANFDTSPDYSGSGFNGSWGAYPFLPSGVILASDIEQGLFILDIEYIRGAFVEGVVRDINTNSPLFNVTVEVLGTDLITQTAFDGGYEFGTTISGTYDVSFTADGYEPKTITGVGFVNGEINIVNAGLEEITVGLSEAELNDLKISFYPNPFRESLTVELLTEKSGASCSLSVRNAAGIEVQRINPGPGRNEIQLGNELSAGTYFLLLIYENQVISTERIVKY